MRHPRHSEDGGRQVHDGGELVRYSGAGNERGGGGEREGSRERGDEGDADAAFGCEGFVEARGGGGGLGPAGAVPYWNVGD